MKAPLKTLLALTMTLCGCQGPGERASVVEVRPYELDTCVITDSKLGSMGDPITKVYGDREVKFCCAPCIEEFEKDPEVYIEMMDEALAAEAAGE